MKALSLLYIKFAQINPEIRIFTIEYDIERYQKAVENITKLNLDDQITVFLGDALKFDFTEKFDLIFIDAAKAQNIKFFEMFEYNLKEKGTIITDNMNFHGLVDKEPEDIKSRNLRALVRKLKDYAVFLRDNKKFDTEFLDIGDGIAISRPI